MEILPRSVEPATPPTLCSQGPRQMLIEAYILAHMRRHFDGQVHMPSIRDYRWNAAVADSDIQIELLDVWNPDKAGQRPAVLIRGNDETSQVVGIGNTLQSPGDLQVYGRYIDHVHGSLTVFCLSTEAGEAGILAHEVYQELKHFGPRIRGQLGLLRWVHTQKGRVQQIKEAKDHYGAPLTFAYGYEEIWTLRQHTPRISSIVLTT